MKTTISVTFIMHADFDLIDILAWCVFVRQEMWFRCCRSLRFYCGNDQCVHYLGFSRKWEGGLHVVANLSLKNCFMRLISYSQCRVATGLYFV